MKYNIGFSIIELMTALFIFLILMTLSLEGWHHFVVGHRLNVYSNRLMQAIHFTRQLAMTRGEPVSLCGSADSQRCDGQWQRGMITIIPTTGEILRLYPGVWSGYQLVWRSSLGLNISLNFNANGFTQGQQGAFYLCPPQGQSMALRLIVNRTGRLRVERAPVYALCSFSP